MEDGTQFPPNSAISCLKGKRKKSPTYEVLAAATAIRNVGFLRPYAVAIQEAVASANKWVPLAKPVYIRLESSP